ncbi:MAG: hypothetical protein GY786_21845 [Proteobacteria bacterium]|nr:hypothetical protein [Pseudomonadota bacterium]
MMGLIKGRSTNSRAMFALTKVVKSDYNQIFVFFLRRIILLLILSITVLIGNSHGQVNIHTSLMANSDLIGEQQLGLDLTILFNTSWGFRYTRTPDLVVVDGNLQVDESQLTSTKVKGDFTHLSVIQTIDYRTFNQTEASPFDFLTAYWGVGYSQNDFKLTRRSYQAQVNQLVSSDSFDHVVIPFYTLSLGLYGGDKHVVVDTQLQFFRAEIAKSNLNSDRIDVTGWKILFAIGLGY